MKIQDLLTSTKRTIAQSATSLLEPSLTSSEALFSKTGMSILQNDNKINKRKSDSSDTNCTPSENECTSASKRRKTHDLLRDTINLPDLLQTTVQKNKRHTTNSQNRTSQYAVIPVQPNTITATKVKKPEVTHEVPRFSKAIYIDQSLAYRALEKTDESLSADSKSLSNNKASEQPEKTTLFSEIPVGTLSKYLLTHKLPTYQQRLERSIKATTTHFNITKISQPTTENTSKPTKPVAEKLFTDEMKKEAQELSKLLKADREAKEILDIVNQLIALKESKSAKPATSVANPTANQQNELSETPKK